MPRFFGSRGVGWNEPPLEAICPVFIPSHYARGISSPRSPCPSARPSTSTSLCRSLLTVPWTRSSIYRSIIFLAEQPHPCDIQIAHPFPILLPQRLRSYTTFPSHPDLPHQRVIHLPPSRPQLPSRCGTATCCLRLTAAMTTVAARSQCPSSSQSCPVGRLWGGLRLARQQTPAPYISTWLPAVSVRCIADLKILGPKPREAATMPSVQSPSICFAMRSQVLDEYMDAEANATCRCNQQ